MQFPSSMAFRALAATLASLASLSPAWAADVRTLLPSQVLARPTDRTFTHFAQGVAIDGSAIIVLAADASGQSALLYRRSSGSSHFNYQRALVSVSDPSAAARVSMKNGIAAVQFGTRVWIFETVGGDYVPGTSAAPIQHPGGLAISGHSILIGGDNCDYDAVVYEKGADGKWGITGRMDDNQGDCHPEGLAVELNSNYALLRVPLTNVATAWRRNGTALAWLPAGTVTMPSDAPPTYGPLALQKDTAVTPGSFVFRRDGNIWTPQGKVIPVDYGNGAGDAFDVKYRDGVLITTETWANYGLVRPYVYVESSPGRFENVAVLQPQFQTIDYDVSGRTVVTAVQKRTTGEQDVALYILPTELMAPRPIVDDFEDHDTSDLTFYGGQFALATRGTDVVLAQTAASGYSRALVNGSDWTNFQRVEADITPAFGAGGGGWVGLIARYVDSNNFYYVTIRHDNTFGLYRRLNGVTTLLTDGSSFGALPTHVVLIVNEGEIHVYIGGPDGVSPYVGYARDSSLLHGRAGLATVGAAADFDDLHVTATEPIALLTKEYSSDEYSPREDFGRPFTELGGDWQVQRDEAGNLAGLAQRDATRSAFAYIGAPVRNQEIEVLVGIKTLSSPTASWIGLLARYVDAQTYYSVTLRSTNQVQIRKRVNGVATLLASAKFAATPGQSYLMRFRLIEDTLQVFIDGALVTSVHDDEISAGQYGIATNRAAATWDFVRVNQP